MLYLKLKNTITKIVETLLPRYKEESNMKVLNIGIRYSRMWHLASSPNETTLTKEEIQEIRDAVMASNLPISFDGWSFDTDVNYQLNFVILHGSSYYCFSRTPDNIQMLESEWKSEWTNEPNIYGYRKDNHDQNGMRSFFQSGFNNPTWKFTTYHDSCWRDGAFRNIEKCDNQITNFIYELGKKYNIPNLIKYNTPNFTDIETIQVYPLHRFMRSWDDLYVANTNHYFYKGKDEAVIWVDLSSREFKNYICDFMKNKNGFENGDFIFDNPTSSELAVKNSKDDVYIFSREELEEIFSYKEEE